MQLLMSLYTYFRISKPSASKVAENEVDKVYKRLRARTFWGATAAYSLYYVCRMTLSVVKQPLIDSGLLTAGELGLVGSALLFIYALGKFTNGFIADYCNIRRFMAVGLFVSAVVNLVMGALGLLGTLTGISGTLIFIAFFILWGVNGWVQSMGAPPGIINLSRWFPLSKRGTYYSIFSASPYLGKFLTFILTGVVVGALGWEWGFIFAAAAGVCGGVITLLFVSDTPESKGLPSVQTLSGETPKKVDSMPTRELQKIVLRHPGIWIIAVSSAFVYITQYAISGWGVLFLQKARDFSLPAATQIIAFSEAFGVAGTVFAGWLSDTVFRGNRVKPVVEKPNYEKQDYLAKQNYLPPMNFFAVFKPSVNKLRNRRSDKERNNGNKVFPNFAPLSEKHRRTQQHHIARLRVRKNFISATVCVCVLKTAGKNYKNRRPKRVGHLPCYGF